LVSFFKLLLTLNFFISYFRFLLRNIDHILFPIPYIPSQLKLIPFVPTTSFPTSSSFPSLTFFQNEKIGKDPWLNAYTQFILQHYSMVLNMTDSGMNIPNPNMISPSIVPNYNPTLRIYHLQNGILMDYDQYWGSLEDWRYKQEIEFKLSYTALNSFDMKEWNRYEWMSGLRKIIKNETFRQDFLNRMVVSRYIP